MSVGPLVLELIAAFCIALFLLHHYGRIKRQHPIVTIATLTSWYFSLIIVFILPLDVSSVSNFEFKVSMHIRQLDIAFTQMNYRYYWYQ